MKKETVFRNRINGEEVICRDTRRDVEIVDGIEFYIVHRKDSLRTFKMRKDALEKVRVVR